MADSLVVVGRDTGDILDFFEVVANLFGLGLAGGTGSAEKRRELLKRLGLPEHLTANGMLEALNLLFSREELEALLAEA